jgi:hypothetical protein
VEQLQQILKRKDLRSADRAQLKRIVGRMRSGGAISYQERQNLQAYVVRYGRLDAPPR